MFGAFGSILDHNYYMGTQNGVYTVVQGSHTCIFAMIDISQYT